MYFFTFQLQQVLQSLTMPLIYRIILKGTNSKFQKYEIQETRPREQHREKRGKRMECSERLKKKKYVMLKMKYEINGGLHFSA